MSTTKTEEIWLRLVNYINVSILLGYYTIILHNVTIGIKWGMCTDSPQLMIWHRFFWTLQWYKSNTHSVETILKSFNFFPGLLMCM